MLPGRVLGLLARVPATVQVPVDRMMVGPFPERVYAVAPCDTLNDEYQCSSVRKHVPEEHE